MKSIFVGNLNFSTSEDEIRSIFQIYGIVERVNLKTDRGTGRSRGFAFVEMPDSDEAEKAMTALNGKSVNGRALTVTEARPLPNQHQKEQKHGFPPFGSGPSRRQPLW